MKDELADALDQLFDSKVDARTKASEAIGADDGADRSAEWHLELDDVEVGPLSLAEVGRLVEQGRVDPSTMVWREGQSDWLRAGDVAEIDALFVAPPIPPTPRKASTQLASLVETELARAEAAAPATRDQNLAAHDLAAPAPASLIPEPLPAFTPTTQPSSPRETSTILLAAAIGIVVVVAALATALVVLLARPARVVYVMPPSASASAPAIEPKPAPATSSPTPIAPPSTTSEPSTTTPPSSEPASNRAFAVTTPRNPTSSNMEAPAGATSASATPHNSTLSNIDTSASATPHTSAPSSSLARPTTGPKLRTTPPPATTTPTTTTAAKARGKDTLWPDEPDASTSTEAKATGLSKGQVLAGVHDGIPAVKACASKHGATEKLARVGWRITASGRVVDVKILDSAIAGTPLGACIAGALASWKFEAAGKDTLIKAIPLPLN
jgi:hypothetical protein